MPSGVEPDVEAFFASRGGVCVYVKVQGHTFRVQFADPNAHGTVSEGADGPAAERALELARSALTKHSVALAGLFDQVARGRT
jgi:hypothetical protein